MNSDLPIDETIQAAAAEWMARRDRCLSAAEQDGYLQWLAENPEHARAIARLECAWNYMDRLEQWRPAHSASPNPDLLAKSGGRRRWFLTGALAAAASIALAFVWQPFGVDAPVEVATPSARLVRNSEVRNLADGSSVELHRGSDIAVDFTGAERKVRLLAGEAHFTVAKNLERPFVVDANGVNVRALGTAFNVKLQPDSVQVLVTEGTVRVDQPAISPQPVIAALTVGESTTVRFDAPSATPQVAKVDAGQIERALAWQGLRIVFDDSPLAVALDNFNRYSGGPRIDIAHGSAELAQMKIGGSFRADNVEGFVRLLETGFGVTVERTTTGRILLRAQH